ncbi:hypothetical protein OXYTRIMIC_688 [Oxytricha trifallax]|uniref:Uncharacterized protein n=1 Tax=Oxytricha trifallax TaxID=1172189 RepID=A0A073HXL9_9SPIT|nr:hypothetical protein OXYTRIMIC_688 [Oxytricha trifallax]
MMKFKFDEDIQYDRNSNSRQESNNILKQNQDYSDQEDYVYQKFSTDNILQSNRDKEFGFKESESQNCNNIQGNFFNQLSLTKTEENDNESNQIEIQLNNKKLNIDRSALLPSDLLNNMDFQESEFNMQDSEQSYIQNPQNSSIQEQLMQMAQNYNSNGMKQFQTRKLPQANIPKNNGPVQSNNIFSSYQCNSLDQGNQSKSKVIQNPRKLELGKVQAVAIRNISDFDKIDVKSVLKKIKKDDSTSMDNQNQSSSSGTSDYNSDLEDMIKQNQSQDREDFEDYPMSEQKLRKKSKQQRFLDKAQTLRDELGKLKDESNNFMIVMKQLTHKVATYLKYHMTKIENEQNGNNYCENPEQKYRVTKQRKNELSKMTNLVQLFRETLKKLPLNKIYLPDEDCYLDTDDLQQNPQIPNLIGMRQEQQNALMKSRDVDMFAINQ